MCVHVERECVCTFFRLDTSSWLPFSTRGQTPLSTRTVDATAIPGVSPVDVVLEVALLGGGVGAKHALVGPLAGVDLDVAGEVVGLMESLWAVRAPVGGGGTPGGQFHTLNGNGGSGKRKAAGGALHKREHTVRKMYCMQLR